MLSNCAFNIEISSTDVSVIVGFSKLTIRGHSSFIIYCFVHYIINIRPFCLTVSLALLDVQFLPISGLVGTNMKTRMDKSICNWWDGPCFFEVLDRIEVPLRDPKGPVRLDFFFSCTSYHTQKVYNMLDAQSQNM